METHATEITPLTQLGWHPPPM